MKYNVNTEELKEAARETHRRLQNALERKMDEAEELKIQMRVVEATQELLDEMITGTVPLIIFQQKLW